VIALALCCAALSGQEGRSTPAVYETLVLPHVLNGLADTERTGGVLNAPLDGRLLHRGEVLWDAESAECERPWKALDAVLAAAAAAQTGERAPILLRADVNADFTLLRDVLQRGARAGLRHYDLAVGDARSPRFDPQTGLVPQAVPQQRLPYELPTDAPPGEDAQEDAAGSAPPHRSAIEVRVKEPGRRLEVLRSEEVPWKGESGTRFRWDRATRRVEYTVAGRTVGGVREVQAALNGMLAALRRTGVAIDAGPGVTVGEVLLLLDTLRGGGVKDVAFRCDPRGAR